MASIKLRIAKNGKRSYLLRVFIEQGPDGHQTTRNFTWHVPDGMSPKAAEKQAYKEAAILEQAARSGLVSCDGKIRFADYAARWLETAELAPKTHEQYTYLLRRTNKAIGHVALEKLQADHLKKFYRTLREEGTKETGSYAVSEALAEKRQAMKLSLSKLAAMAGLSAATVGAACQGKHVSVESAKKIASALAVDVADLFTIHKGNKPLSDKTIRHYHTVIRAVLAAAKRERIIPFNVAAEHMEAPKMARTEARYLDDEEAKVFLAALREEPDIRIKTALILDLFTGARRGELCGLQWPDIDTKNSVIHIRRASQYVSGKGVIEVPTKNNSSTRDIKVTPFVMEVLNSYRKWWVEQRLKWGKDWQGEQERLFIQDNGRPIFPDTINNWLRGFIERNGLPHITPHGLRHTFATLQITSGLVDIRTLQARTGHAQASTLLNVYSHAIQSAQDKAAEALDEVLLQSGT